MTEIESTISNSDYKHKEMLYTLFYELTSEIKGCKIEIDEDEYQENIRTINFTQLINYVRDSIQILLKKKSDIIKEKDEKLSKAKIQIRQGDLVQYENLLQKFEQNERRLLKRQFQHRLQREAMENKLSELMDMEEEFEEMKAKLKYENGKFLTNDRKDNEILIIRGENINLKKAISSLEDKVKTHEKTIEDCNKEISSLKELNEKLKTKLEEKQKELNLFSNININICNDQNNSSTHPQLEKCPYCNNSMSITKRESKPEASPTLKMCHFQKVKPTLMKKNTTLPSTNAYLNQTSTSLLHANHTKHESNSDRSKNDFLSKYFTNKHSKSKSQLNHSSIKITRLPMGHLSNRSNAHIPLINQGNISANNLSAYKQLFNNSTMNSIMRKSSNKTNNSTRHGDNN